MYVFCMSVCMHVCVYVYIYVCVCFVFVSMYVYVYVCTHVRMYACMYVVKSHSCALCLPCFGHLPGEEAEEDPRPVAVKFGFRVWGLGFGV